MIDRTPTGSARYKRPSKRRRPLPAGFPAIHEPTHVRTLAGHLRSKKRLRVSSDKVCNTYRAAGYTIMRSDDGAYENAAGATCYPLVILPLQGDGSATALKAGAGHRRNTR